MAGKNIREFLDPPDRERFYELYHGLTEQIQLKVLAMHTYCQLLKLYSTQVPEFALEPVAAAHLEEFAAFVREFHTVESSFFFPKPATDTPHNHLASIQRWQPYDEAAWDTMVAQTIEMLQPFLAPARRHYEIAISYAQGESWHWDALRDWLTKIDQSLNDLAQLNDSQKIEAFFRFHPKQNERRP